MKIEAKNIVSVYQSDRSDPTRTTVLRNSFERQMVLRFNKISKEIITAVNKNDVFGLKEVQVNISEPRQFAFPTTSDKVEAFMNWLQDLVNKNILEVGYMTQIGRPIQNAWVNVYIEDSYQRGVQRARYEMIKAGYDVPALKDTGGIAGSMSVPIHADRLGAMYTRVFTDLKGITDNMQLQISRVLTQGLIDGDNPNLLARKLNAVIKGGGGELGITDTIGRYVSAERRARMLARTEIIRAHHIANIQEYRNWGIEGIKVQAEWSTAGYNVCPICESMAKGGKNNDGVYTLDEISSMIPRHPNCRCMAIPVPINELKK